MSKSMVNSYKEKKTETIAYFITKGVDWLANQLFNARLEIRELKDALRYKQDELRIERARNVVCNQIELENYTLKDVLQSNGIRPRKLIVSYTIDDCDNCDYATSEYDDDNYDCYITRQDGECPQKTITKSMAFYAFEINDGLLSGITSKFEKLDDVILLEVTDEKTGKCLYKYEPKEDET